MQIAGRSGVDPIGQGKHCKTPSKSRSSPLCIPASPRQQASLQPILGPEFTRTAVFLIRGVRVLPPESGIKELLKHGFLHQVKVVPGPMLVQHCLSPAFEVIYQCIYALQHGEVCLQIRVFDKALPPLQDSGKQGALITCDPQLCHTGSASIAPHLTLLLMLWWLVRDSNM